MSGSSASSALSIKGTFLEGRSVYLDMQATTPLDPRVLDAMLPFMTEMYGNPHSRTHHYGWETENAIEAARQVIAFIARCVSLPTEQFRNTHCSK